ncbi:MAG TPA: H-X9-DG-CTERM domain-containing protein [Verrucomicrobiae bacterium]|nr:H-X9-DG-CTERM domain-containing protein [Verrucomicrobiae bacterium]
MKLTKEQHFLLRRAIHGSFTLWDLIAVLFVVVLLGVWFVFAHTGERGRIIRCTANLKVLGEVTQSFANDHNDGIPAATIDTTYMNGGGVISWDTQLAPYLEPRLAQAKSVYEKSLVWPAGQHHLACPSDPIKRPNPRSYAMSWRRWLYGWPPASEDKAGVGVTWNKATISRFLDSDLAQRAAKHPELLPRLQLSVISDPDQTMLFTELIQQPNMVGRIVCTQVGYVQAQKEAFNGDSSHFHFGKFNYLMADGHVELLSGSKTDGSDGKSHNIWIINPGD